MIPPRMAPAPTTRKADLLAALDGFDRKLEDFSRCVVGTDPDQLALLAIELQKSSLALAGLLQRIPPQLQHDADLRAIGQRLATRLGVLRESVLRQTAVVQQALAVLMPAAKTDTYTPPAAGRALRSRYGSAGAQSGEFKSFSV